MFLDNNLPGGSGVAVTGTADTIIGNVFDAVSAKKLYGGSAGLGPKCAVAVTAIGGTTPTARVRFVAADDAALSTNPIILWDSGVSRVLVAGDLPVMMEGTPAEQIDAKRFYGFLGTLGGTAPTGTITANVVADAQSAGIH